MGQQNDFVLIENEKLEVLKQASNSFVLIELVRILKPINVERKFYNEEGEEFDSFSETVDVRDRDPVNPYILRIFKMREGDFIGDLMSTRLSSLFEAKQRFYDLALLLRVEIEK